jgi:ABC-2 type transport system permease protein
VATGAISRTLVVASNSFVGAFAGGRGILLSVSAAIFPALVLGIDAARFPGLDLLATSETLFSALFLPVILLLVCLVLAAGAFRNELEEDTLVYLLDRTLPRSSVAAGKYLGFLGAAGIVLVPSAVIGVSLAALLGTGPTGSSSGLAEAVLLLPALAIAAYGAIFFVLGLATRQALVIGLLYGFVWETFISLVAGPVRQLTVVYYLRGVGLYLAPGGGLGAGVAPMAPGGVAAGVVLLAVGSVALAAAILRYAEIRPAAAPA